VGGSHEGGLQALNLGPLLLDRLDQAAVLPLEVVDTVLFG
jgi:hypothetical protein